MTTELDKHRAACLGASTRQVVAEELMGALAEECRVCGSRVIAGLGKHHLFGFKMGCQRYAEHVKAQQAPEKVA